ncbi:hypothetical protein [Nostoc sp. PCC 7107]|uniref:hypothetical protein n=1 Tax=Nostoc sp. PCC 7107 TaxID=317936 RepID=UPI00030551B9|nr:hypothetical protein [Nostoc sp. PCC 7107]
MEIITSWEKKALEKVAVNSLREGLSVETVARITGLTVEQVQELQIKLADVSQEESREEN